MTDSDAKTSVAVLDTRTKLPKISGAEAAVDYRDDFVRDATTRIQVRMSRTIQDIVDIGRDLLAVKERVGHGNFLDWIETDFKGMSEDTAARFMNVARNMADHIPHGAVFQPSALYALAAPNTSIEVREAASSIAADGKKVTLKDVKKLKAELAAKSERVEASDRLIAALEDRLTQEAAPTNNEAAKVVDFRSLVTGAVYVINLHLYAEQIQTFWNAWPEFDGAALANDIDRTIKLLTALRANYDEKIKAIPRLEAPAITPEPDLSIPAFLKREKPAPSQITP